MNTRTRRTGFASTATAVVLAASMAPAPAYAAVESASLQEKAAALIALGIQPSSTFTGQKDCDLTISIWDALKTQTNRNEVRAAAVSAFASPTVLQQKDSTPCTLFIRTEVYAAKQRDVAIEVAAQEQDRVDRELKQKAALTIGLTISTDQLGMILKEFVTELRNSDRAGARVKAAADVANNGTDDDRRAFLGDGVVAAHEADRLAEIEAEAAGNEALRLKLIEEAARRRALAVLLVAATDGMLAATDRDFITYIWENAEAGTEVRGAAERAVLSREPADWKNYIHTGIHEAREADRQAAARKKYQEDVAKADKIITDATANGHINLVHATRKALAGSATELDEFIRVGQFDLDLTTGLEAADIGLTWSNTLLPNGLRNVDNCLPFEVRTKNLVISVAEMELTRAEMEVSRIQGAIELATTAAERAKLAAELAKAKAAVTPAKNAVTKAEAELNACHAKKPELTAGPMGRAHGGANALRLVGADQNATQSFAYFQALNLDRVVVSKDTKLTYWVYPDGTDYGSTGSTCVAVDLIFSNGANLRDSGAVDQNGNRAHPAHQCGKLKANQWNQVVVPLGGLFNTRSVTRLDIAYDQPANTGAFRALIDDISITG